MTHRDRIIGRGLFEVFPDNPDDPAASGVSNLRASLARVLQFRRPDAMAVQKYDIRRPASEGGGFEVRHWAPLNSPVLNEAGEVAWIIHRVEDVTEMIRLQAKDEARGAQARDQKNLIDELQETSTFLDAVVENLPGMLFVKSYPDCRFVLFNRAGEQLLGLSPRRAHGQERLRFLPQGRGRPFRRARPRGVRTPARRN